MARPTEYSDKVLKAAQSYVETYDQEGEPVPTIAGLAVYLDISRPTVYEWAARYPEFSDTIEKLKAVQERELLANGLNGGFNSTITKLALAANHHYVERQDVTSDDKPVQPLLVRFLGDEPTNNGNTEGV